MRCWLSGERSLPFGLLVQKRDNSVRYCGRYEKKKNCTWKMCMCKLKKRKNDARVRVVQTHVDVKKHKIGRFAITDRGIAVGFILEGL